MLVVMDPVAILPFLVPFLGSLDPSRRGRVVRISLVTGVAVGLVFLGMGRGIFIVLGIGVSDFLIAGGIVLLVISLRDLVTTGPESPTAPNELVAVVPIGTPLLVGPATISMLILLSGLYNLWLVVIAFLANILIAWAVFTQSNRITAVLGSGGLQAFAKIAYILLAAIAVQLIREGLVDIVQQYGWAG
ncbi:MAG: MarC family protein [Chloroflexi bacterium]|nr:MarC family protein [Chloroflexota bacterium]